VADDEVPADDGPDPFEGLTLDESWVQQARRSEDDAETRLAKLSRIDADYRRLGSDRQTLVTNADRATRRSRNRKRLIAGLVLVGLVGLGVATYVRRQNDGGRPSPTTTTSTTTTVAPTTTLPPLPSSTSPSPALNTASFDEGRS
jgi:hypothetical protein